MAFGDSGGTSFPAIGSSRMRIMSMWTLYLTSFLGATGYSIIMASALPFLQQLQPSVKTTFYGYIIGAFSLGQLLGSPVLGVASNYIGFMIPFQFCLVIMFMANVLYGCLNAFSSDVAPFMMLVSRFLVGVGSGNVAIVRSFASVTSTMEERTSVLANISAAQALGFIIGPLLQTLFVSVGETGIELDFLHIRLSMYTLPVFLSAFLCVVNLIMFWVYFTDGPIAATRGIARRRPRTIIISDYTIPRRHQYNSGSVVATASQSEVQPFLATNGRYTPDTQSAASRDVTVQYSSEATCLTDSDEQRSRAVSFNRDSERDSFALVLCIYLWIVVLTTFSFYEVLVVPILEVMTTWTPREATFVASLLFGGCSFLSFATMFSLKFTSRSNLKERHILAVSLVLMTLSFVVVMPYSSEHLDVYTPSVNGGGNNSATVPVSERRGCDSTKFDWCHKARKIYMLQLIAGGVINCVGYAASVVLISTIYSKIIGPFPQGALQGALTAAGSVARFIGPLLVSQLFQHYGPFFSYFTQLVNIAVCTCVQIVFNRRFIQHILTREFGVNY